MIFWKKGKNPAVPSSMLQQYPSDNVFVLSQGMLFTFPRDWEPSICFLPPI
jgi:hypothetical protein